jgi:S1-C subfamily serine protease
MRSASVVLSNVACLFGGRRSQIAIKSAHSRSSGFFWRPGLIITAEETLSEEGDVTVTVSSGESLAARLVGRDHTTDIALLRVDRSDVPRIPLETKPVPVGALALAVGAEDGAPTAAAGVVSRSFGSWWSLRGGEINARIELDLRMRQSAEGGLGIDATGRANRHDGVRTEAACPRYPVCYY